MIEEDEIEQEEDVPAKKTIDRKKMLIFILPVLIVIGLSVGFYYALNSDYGGNGAAQYNVVKHTPSADGAEKISVFYDLPEVSVNLKSSGPDRQRLHLRINIELSSIEDIKIVIDKKTSEWINNPKMSSYLRPETLLGSKFERYLYQKNEPKTIKDITLADIQKAKEIRDNKKNG